MKIQKIELKNYKQFKDLTLDLTYPKGHKKEGEPLDKICIIGQSGVGKTNLIEVIRDKIYMNEAKVHIVNAEESDSEEVYFKDVKEDSTLNYQDIKISKEDKDLISKLKSVRSKLLIEDKGDYNKNPFSYENINSEIKSIESKYKVTNNLKPQSFIYIDETAWKLLKDKIDNYDTEKLKYKGRLSNKLLNIDNYEKKDFKDELQEWEAKNENILEKISNRLNEILIKFNLQLTKIDKNQKCYNDLIFKDLSNEKIIKYDDLSTGTKNIISTFIPLKIHNPKDSIILIDEPENSFYPDIQRKLTDLYMEVGENNQLIMATHSPLIASSFEPWEVVELKFDGDNQVYRELYYEGDRHIDNYTLDPRLLTWTGILVDIFDMKEDSNSLEREKALMKYIRLERELKEITDKNLKKEKFEELMKLSDLLGLIHNEEN